MERRGEREAANKTGGMMEAMETNKVDPFTGALNFLAKGMQGPLEQITDRVVDITIDSCLASDTRLWETGIKRPSIEGKWVIVEQYKDKPHAEEGHKKWVKLMKESPDFPLEDIDQWSLDP